MLSKHRSVIVSVVATLGALWVIVPSAKLYLRDGILPDAIPPLLSKAAPVQNIDGLTPYEDLPAYWYGTGPANIFSVAIGVGDAPPPIAAVKEGEDKGKRAIDVASQEPDRSRLQEAASATPPPKTFLLLKREGEGNPWHCLMEIFSTYLSLDILRMPRGPSADQQPLVLDPNDSEETQVVILDDRADGPYFDLWTLFARRKPIRMHELLADPSMSYNIKSANLVIPLAGSSNPFWKEDDQAAQCTDSVLLDVFTRRVLDFFQVPDTVARSPDKPITVTFINRRGSRRLQNQNFLIAELNRRNPHIRVQMIDFAALSFSEQIRVSHETDVLVGVHGAGLTHLMFLRERAGAVVEIQPRGLVHHGFSNIAGMRGIGYYRVHAGILPPERWREGEVEKAGNDEPVGKVTKEERTKDAMKQRDRKEQYRKASIPLNRLVRREEWHFQDVEIEASRFFDVVEAAIKSMYQKGPWSLDVNK
ncbi:hypothetical protein F5Y18DRAFT_417224 [Xylariaceae sp. FL1019]|nr:hypothetical protein F5Y18DRAFT_417224 [Xylariaceae sp. FL1019]